MLKIEMSRLGHRTKIELDGQDVSRFLNKVEVYTSVDEVTRAVLHYLGAVVVEGEAGSLRLEQAPLYVECEKCQVPVQGERVEAVEKTAMGEDVRSYEPVVIKGQDL